jgi:hypothetical protein
VDLCGVGRGCDPGTMIFASDEVGGFDVAHSGFDPSLKMLTDVEDSSRFSTITYRRTDSIECRAVSLLAKPCRNKHGERHSLAAAAAAAAATTTPSHRRRGHLLRAGGLGGARRLGRVRDAMASDIATAATASRTSACP